MYQACPVCIPGATDKKAFRDLLARFGPACARGWLVVLIATVPSSAARSGAPEEPAANPGRPTVVTPATLPPVG